MARVSIACSHLRHALDADTPPPRGQTVFFWFLFRDMGDANNQYSGSGQNNYTQHGGL